MSLCLFTRPFLELFLGCFNEADFVLVLADDDAENVAKVLRVAAAAMVLKEEVEEGGAGNDDDGDGEEDDDDDEEEEDEEEDMTII